MACFKPYEKINFTSTVNYNDLTGDPHVRPMAVKYNGTYNRIYFCYDAIVSSNRRVYVYWYDLDTETFSSAYLVPSIIGAGTDAHNVFSINVTPDGHILICMTRDDSFIYVGKSTYPEFNDGGSIDTTFTQTSPISGSITAKANYGCTIYQGERLILDWRGKISALTQEDRSMSYSDDDGATWEPTVTYLTLDSDHWAYGAHYTDNRHGGYFATISIRENDSTGGYPVWGIIWTDDFETFGNLEYYSSGKASGWSKNVVSSGVITDAEFVANCAVVNGGYGVMGHHALQCLQPYNNGDIAAISLVGTRPASIIVTDLRFSYYTYSTNSWTHTIIPLASLPSTLSTSSIQIRLVGCDSGNFYAVTTTAAGGVDLWQSTSGMLSWSFVETLSASGGNKVCNSNDVENNGGGILTYEDGTNNVGAVIFDFVEAVEGDSSNTKTLNLKSRNKRSNLRIG